MDGETNRDKKWFPSVKHEIDDNINWFPNSPTDKTSKVLTIVFLLDEVIALVLIIFLFGVLLRYLG